MAWGIVALDLLKAEFYPVLAGTDIPPEVGWKGCVCVCVCAGWGGGGGAGGGGGGETTMYTLTVSPAAE